ncbi:hypothetical protein TKK_0010090 [Trichogramma kaykai]
MGFRKCRWNNCRSIILIIVLLALSFVLSVSVASDTRNFGIFSNRRIDRRVKGRNTAVRIRHEEVRRFRQHQKSFQPYGEDIGRYVQEYKPRYIQHVRGELQAPPPKPASEQQQQVLGLDRPCPVQCAFAYDEHRETPRPSLCGQRRDPPQAQLPKYRYPPDSRAPIRWPGRKRPHQLASQSHRMKLNRCFEISKGFGLKIQS